jgi:hypothetical protein
MLWILNFVSLFICLPNVFFPEIYIFRIRNTSADDPVTSSVVGSLRHLVMVGGRILRESGHWTGDWLVVGSQQRSKRRLTTRE